MQLYGPRERLLEKGAKALTDEELLAIVLRTGPRALAGGGVPAALNLARKMIQEKHGLAGVLKGSFIELSMVKGIGPSRVALLLAVNEIAQRLWGEGKNQPLETIRSCAEAYRLFSEHAAEEREVVVVAYLNSQHRLIRKQAIFMGSLSSTIAQPREILREALRANAACIVVAHNHPSQNPEPSEEDISFTEQLEWASHCVGVTMLDHLIVCLGGKYFSFAEAGMLGNSKLGR